MSDLQRAAGENGAGLLNFVGKILHTGAKTASVKKALV
jgi:hypothetical protein